MGAAGSSELQAHELLDEWPRVVFRSAEEQAEFADAVCRARNAGRWHGMGTGQGTSGG